MKRIGTLMKLKPGKLEEYVKLHDQIWEGVVKAGHEAGMRNYTIFRQGEYLFSYFEYIGEDFEGDMKRKSELPISKEWQEATGKLREFIEPNRKVTTLEQIWHCDF